MNNNFAISWRLLYSLESLLTRQIMVPLIVIALINCWEHLYNWFENLVYAFCIFIGNDFCDQLSVADCPNWTYGPSTELPSLRYRRQLHGSAEPGAAPSHHEQFALWCPEVDLVNLWVLWGWFHTAKCFNSAYKSILSNCVGWFTKKGWPMSASNLQLV